MKRDKFKEGQFRKQVVKPKESSQSLQMKWSLNSKSMPFIEIRKRLKSKSASKGKSTRLETWKLNVFRCTKSLKRQCPLKQLARYITKARVHRLTAPFLKPTTTLIMLQSKKLIHKQFNRIK